MAELPPGEVFLAYAREDREWATAFARALKDAGVLGLFDPEDVAVGTDWVEATRNALRNSRTMVVILSPHSVRSGFVQGELGVAISSNQHIIPILSETLEPGEIPDYLRNIRALEMTSPDETGRRVAQALTMVSG